MGGWVSFGVDTSYQNQNQDTYGTRTPILSQGWQDAYDSLKGNVNSSGANAIQQSAINYLTGNMGAASKAAQVGNDNLGSIGTWINNLANKDANLLGSSPTAATAIANTALSGGTDRISAGSGADYMSRYQNPFQKDVIDASLADYDAGAARDLAALRGANAGSFGNKRFGVAEGQFAADSARGRGSLVSGLRSQGFNTAAGLGMADADRTLSADTTNAANLLSNNQFNANAQNNMNQFNANSQNNMNQFNTNIQNDRDKYNVDSMNKKDQLSLDALRAQAGMTQDQINNVFTANGIDTGAAQALFAVGAITQSQLQDILSAAGQTNGYSWTENKNTDTTSVGAKASFGS